MNDTPRPRKHPGTSPLWANLPRRKCDDCGKSYKPVRPVKENERGFCTPNCRKSYHKHGGAYRKLKVEILKLMEKTVRAVIREEVQASIRELAAASISSPRNASSPL